MCVFHCNPLTELHQGWLRLPVARHTFLPLLFLFHSRHPGTIGEGRGNTVKPLMNGRKSCKSLVCRTLKNMFLSVLLGNERKAQGLSHHSCKESVLPTPPTKATNTLHSEGVENGTLEGAGEVALKELCGNGLRTTLGRASHQDKAHPSFQMARYYSYSVQFEENSH